MDLERWFRTRNKILRSRINSPLVGFYRLNPNLLLFSRGISRKGIFSCGRRVVPIQISLGMRDFCHLHKTLYSQTLFICPFFESNERRRIYLGREGISQQVRPSAMLGMYVCHIPDTLYTYDRVVPAQRICATAACRRARGGGGVGWVPGEALKAATRSAYRGHRGIAFASNDLPRSTGWRGGAGRGGS